MSTRSGIAIQNTDGTIESIYCHSDGYPSHNGSVLLNHYQDEAKVRQLIGIGGLSFLDREIGTKHDFDKRPKGECNFFTRDRDEEDMQAEKFNNESDLLESFESSDEEYLYLFRDGKWFIFNDSRIKPEFILLTEEICNKD